MSARSATSRSSRRPGTRAAAYATLTVPVDVDQARTVEAVICRPDFSPMYRDLLKARALLSRSLGTEAAEFSKEYTAKYYHQTSDEYHDWWDADAMVQESEFALAFGIKIANLAEKPRYKDTDEFSAADKKRFQK